MKLTLLLSLIFLYSCSHGPAMNRTIPVASWDALKEESVIRWDQQRLSTLTSSNALCYQGEVKKGLDSLKKSFYERRRNSHYWIEVGNCYFLSKKFSQAEFYYQLALNETKNNKVKGMAYNNLGIIALEQKNWSIAQELFLQSIKQDGSLKVPRYNLALLYLDFNLIDQAQKLVENYRNISDVDFLVINARIYLLKNDLKSAGVLFNKLPDFSLKRADISVLYAWYLTLVKDFNRAGNVLSSREPSSIKELERFGDQVSDSVSVQTKGK
ncbi:MAG TPA: hypothetical protein VKZ84_05200 [Bacteriovoracaceae bacterium]|nr:hypothetical protein [Bacteriovoracaceae bacterium]